MSYVSATLRRLVVEHARGCCEYCLRHQTDDFLPFEIEHVIAEKHRGQTIECSYCNGFNGSDIGSLDPDTNKLVPLFNPRTQVWPEPFVLKDAIIVPLTPETGLFHSLSVLENDKALLVLQAGGNANPLL